MALANPTLGKPSINVPPLSLTFFLPNSIGESAGTTNITLLCMSTPLKDHETNRSAETSLADGLTERL